MILDDILENDDMTKVGLHLSQSQLPKVTTPNLLPHPGKEEY